MTLYNRFHSLRNHLWQRRSKLPLLLVPAAFIALWIAVPFAIYHGLYYLILCVGFSIAGFLIRGQALSVSFAFPSNTPETGDASVSSFLTEGIYGRIRYPLYVGNFLVWFGWILFVGVSWFIMGATLVYMLCYLIVLSREEELLLEKYGENYSLWCEKTPALVPDRIIGQRLHVQFAWLKVLRREFRYWTGMTFLFLLLMLVKQRVITLSWDDSLNTLMATGVMFLLFLLGRLIVRKKHAKNKKTNHSSDHTAASHLEDMEGNSTVNPK